MSMENLANSPVDKQVGQQKDEDEIDLMGLLLVVAKYNRFIIKLTAGAAVLAVVVSLNMPDIYTGQTVVQMQKRESSPASMLLGQLGGLAGVAGGAMGIKNPADQYVGLLKSRTVEDALIQRFKLQSLYQAKTLQSTRASLEGSTAISAGKDGFIKIEFSNKDPELAAAVANAYVEELLRLSTRLDADDAQATKQFYEKQLKEVRENLNRAELEMKAFQEKNRVFRFGGGGGGDVSTGGFGGMVLGATGEIPAAELDFIRIAREVKFQEAMLVMMTQQVVASKLDAAKDSRSLQVVDRAVLPEKKSKPKRALIVALVTFFTLFVGILGVFFKDAAERSRKNPEQTERMNLLKRYFLRGC